MEQSNFSRRTARRGDAIARSRPTANGYRGAYDTHTLVNSLHVLHHLIETAHEVGAVDLGQGGMVPAEGLGLVHELLPAGVAGEQGPLFPPAENDR